MDFKFETFQHVDASLPPELQEEVRKQLENIISGAKQALLGEKRKQYADDFLQMIEPERARTLETEITRLHAIRDNDRFRTQLILLFVDAFAGGYQFAKDITLKGSGEGEKAR